MRVSKTAIEYCGGHAFYKVTNKFVHSKTVSKQTQNEGISLTKSNLPVDPDNHGFPEEKYRYTINVTVCYNQLHNETRQNKIKKNSHCQQAWTSHKMNALES